MIDFEAVIRHFGSQAVALQLEEAEKIDNKALTAMSVRSAPDRVAAIRRWFYDYRVFRGIDGLKCAAITEAALLWADSQDQRSSLATLDELVNAHAELMGVCSAADGRGRDFTSLASKALWLRYPNAVPLFDSAAQRVLWVIGKIERDIAPPADEKSEYRKFAYVWKTLYDRYASAIAAIDLQGYPYPVRIFDKVLWIIGTPGYKYD